MSARRIRVDVELDVGGHRIPAEYYDLPDDWDEMSANEQQDLLVEYAKDELSNHATSGACVVDENDEVVE